MKKTISIVLVAFVVGFASGQQQEWRGSGVGQKEKSGSCPYSGKSIGICTFDPTKNCLGDDACPSSQKCCSNGCNKICREPIRTGTVVPKNLQQKNGICPKSDGVVGVCSFIYSNKDCIGDESCSGNLKCCPDGCRRICKAPVVVQEQKQQRKKLGRCPERNVGTAGICVNSCQSDNECLTNLKCCSNGCGSTCTPPVLGRRA